MEYEAVSFLPPALQKTVAIFSDLWYLFGLPKQLCQTAV